MGKRKGVYTVKKGDTLWDIAKKIFHDPEKWKTELKKENGSTYTEEEARYIRPGQPIFYEYPQISHKELLSFS